MAPHRITWLTQRDAASLLGVDPKTMKRWVSDGLVPIHQVEGRRWPMIDQRDIRKLQHRAQAAGKPVMYHMINEHRRKLGRVDRRRVRRRHSEGARA
jgi:predicted site-specific integrase-resolvase